jgi:hypothetical protein
VTFACPRALLVERAPAGVAACRCGIGQNRHGFCPFKAASGPVHGIFGDQPETATASRTHRLGPLNARRFVSDLVRLTQGGYRVIDRQEHRRLKRTKRTATTNRQRDGSH